MAIIPNTTTTIKCDGINLFTPCRHQAEIHQVAAVPLASKAARGFGWSLELGHDRCPECHRINQAVSQSEVLLAA